MTFREPLNGLTHFLGVIMGIVAIILLLIKNDNTPTNYVSFAIFGGTMILLYSFSTLYHWLNISKNKIKIFRKIDHIMIFVFIAGTYTPVCLLGLKGAWGWSIFGVIWGLTICGLFLKLFWITASRLFSTLIYIFMGWIIFIASYPLCKNLSSKGLFFLIVGGIAYSLGATIYWLKKPNFKFFGSHEIFHIFVILGSISHFIMIYHYL